MRQHLVKMRLLSLALVGVTITSCGGTQESSEKTRDSATISTTTSSTPTTTTEPGPTWKTVHLEDIFVAPFAQEVCDLLRTWRPPSETTAEQFSLLSKASKSLMGMILNGDSTTYLTISTIANGAVDYEQRHPNDSVFPITYSLSLDECDSFGFTRENSAWGFDTATGTLKGD